MNSIEEEMEKDGIPKHYSGHESLYGEFTETERALIQGLGAKEAFSFDDEEEELKNRGIGEWYNDPEFKKRYEAEEWDEGAFYDIVRQAMTPTEPLTIGKGKQKTLVMPSMWQSYSIKMSTREVYITKKAFDMLRQIATDEYVYHGAEAAAFLYGKNNIINNVKQYDAIGTAGLVTGNAIDVMEQIQKKKFMGIFHSHLFNSSNPSGTDRDSLNSWCVYAKEIVGKTVMPVSLIGAFPLFKQSAYSMDDALNMIQIRLIVI